jgi:hypothetical protein
MKFTPSSTLESDRFDNPYSQSRFTHSSLSITRTFSSNPKVVLSADFDSNNNTLSFFANNRGNETERLTVDHWILRWSIGGSGGDNVEFDEPNSLSVAPRSSVWILNYTLQSDVDLSTDALVYKVIFEGLNWSEKIHGNDVDYQIRGDVIRHYDPGVIADLGSNKLLKTENTLLIINGTGESFVVDDEHPKLVDIYLVNNGPERISSQINFYSMRVWPISSPEVADGFGANYDYLPGSCSYLDPGEKVRVSSISMSKSFWPIGKNGIAQELGSLSGVPDDYILHFLAYTASCALENEEQIDAANHLMIAAFNVG